jgi:hypothetical protein
MKNIIMFIFFLFSLYIGYIFTNNLNRVDEMDGTYTLSKENPYAGPFKLEGIKNNVVILSSGQREKKVYELMKGEKVEISKKDYKKGSIVIDKITKDKVTLTGKIIVKKDIMYILMIGLISSLMCLGFTKLLELPQIIKKVNKQKY